MLLSRHVGVNGEGSRIFLTHDAVFLLQGVAVGFVLLRVEAAVEDE